MLRRLLIKKKTIFVFKVTTIEKAIYSEKRFLSACHEHSVQTENGAKVRNFQ